MIGLEVQINNEKPIVAVTEALFFTLDYYNNREKGYAYLGGIDRNYCRPKWIDKTLNSGDRIYIKVVDTETTSPVLSAAPIDRRELIRKFEELRDKLIKKGTIQ
jgi:hypothetical protein